MDKILSFSLLDKLYRRGNPIPRCPMHLYSCYLTQEVKGEPSDAMVKGCFLETLCLGSTAREEVVIDLPRKKLTKKRLTMVREDLKGLSIAFDDNNWELAMEWLNDVCGDIEVVREHLQERIDGMEQRDD